MKDYLGNDLSIGDEVLYIKKDYRSFQKGTIHKINKVKVTVSTGINNDPIVVRSPRDIVKILDDQGEWNVI